MAMRLTQPLTEMSTSNLPGGKGRPARKDEDEIGRHVARMERRRRRRRRRMHKGLWWESEKEGDN
jgi:hypothetical protein